MVSISYSIINMFHILLIFILTQKHADIYVATVVAILDSEFNTTLTAVSYCIMLNNFIGPIAIKPNNIPDSELAIEEEGITTDAAAIPDDDRDAHDSVVLKTTHDKAIEMMRAEG